MSLPPDPSPLDSWRGRWAYRAARKATAQRRHGGWSQHPAARTVLVVLPDEDAEVREAWRFLKHLDVPTSNIHPVSRGGHVVYAPDDFIGRVHVLQPSDYRRFTGLPKATTASALWGADPEVAVNLRPRFDLNAAYLVGASPAGFRIGFHDDLAEPFYDFMLAPGASLEQALNALRHYLDSVSPPVFAFRD